MLIDVVARPQSALALLIVRCVAHIAALAQSDQAQLPSQFEFVGSWAPMGTEDVQNDSVPVDYLGLALTDEGRHAGALVRRVAEVDDRAAMPSWGAAYVVLGPFGLRVSSQVDAMTSRLVSFTIEAWEDWKRDDHLDG